MDRQDMFAEKNLVKIIGISGCRAPSNLKQLLSGCVAICSSSRLKEALATEIKALDPQPAIIPITPLGDMFEGLEKHLEKGHCAVFASGDPMFFGIGKRLIKRFGPERVQIFPALSAMQLACARLGLCWDDAQVLSLHGRRDETIYPLMLSSPKSIIFTDGRNSPDVICKKLMELLHGAGDKEATSSIIVHVAEELECPGERIRSMDLLQASLETFSPLNIMILEVKDADLLPSKGIGLNEQEIYHLRGMITKDEIRAVTLHRLRIAPGQVLWDIGAGSGSVGLEAARLYPDLTCYAIEMDRQQQGVIRQNIEKFRLFNLIPIKGVAPDVLIGLPPPNRVFVGGSRGRLEEIIGYCARAILPGGIIVVNAILEKTSQDAPSFMKHAGLEVDMVHVSVTRDGKRHRTHLNPITIIRGMKKGVTG